MKVRNILGGDKVQCARPGCKVKFIKKVHNQKYHSKECCQKVTNEKLLNKYYEKKKPVSKNRVCKTRGCHSILNKYNREMYCGPCQMKTQKEILNKR